MATVSNNEVLLQSSITRPANTTAYAAGDVVSDATGNAHHSFSPASEGKSRSGTVDTVVITSSAYVATGPDLELWLFRRDIAAVADNAAFAPTDAELNTLVGIVAIPTASWKSGNATAGAGGNMAQMVANVGIPFTTDSGTTLYGQLVVRNAYVPVSGEIFTVTLAVRVD